MSATGVTAKDFMLSRGDLRLMGRTQQAMDVHGKTPTMTFEGKQWKTISADIDWASQAPSQWVLLGSTYSQENLYFDENTDFVRRFKIIAEDLCKGKSTRDVLDTVKMMVNRLTEIPGQTRYEVESTLDDRLDAYITDKRKHLKPYEFVNLSFEELAAHKLLVCRHKGLLAASVIGHLVKKGVLPHGTAREYRSVIIDNEQQLLGAHLWATYQDNTTNSLWICDPRFDNVMNINSEYVDAANTYGKLAIDDMITRLTQIEAKKRFNDNLVLIEKAYIKTAPTFGRLLVLQAHDLADKQKMVSILEHNGLAMEFSDKFQNMIIIKQNANSRKFDLYENVLNENHRFVADADTKMFTFVSKVRSAPTIERVQPTPRAIPVTPTYVRVSKQAASHFSSALNYFRSLENEQPNYPKLARQNTKIAGQY